MAREPRKLVSFMLGTYDNAVLDRIAYLDDTSKSDLMRRAIKEYIEDYKHSLVRTTYQYEDGGEKITSTRQELSSDYRKVFDNPAEVPVEVIFREDDEDYDWRAASDLDSLALSDTYKDLAEKLVQPLRDSFDPKDWDLKG